MIIPGKREIRWRWLHWRYEKGYWVHVINIAGEIIQTWWEWDD